MSRFSRFAPRIVPIILGAAAVGCADAPQDAPPPPAVAEAEKGMAWTAQDDPALFGDDLVYTLSDLPREGAAATAPWAANYWPIWQDGYNHRWAGAESQSVMEKFGAAFGIEDLEEAASRQFGIAGQADRKACTVDADCNADIAEKCAKRRGEEAGHCVPTWFGVCHAWAPAAVLFDEPQRPVTRNGVEFAVNDLKALATLLAEDVDVKFVSKRCDDDDSQNKIKYDEYGRPDPNGSCIDTNPATWHLLLANYIGLKQQSFIEDRTFDDEVWNQPLRAFRVTSMDEIDGARANALVGVQPEGAVELSEAGELANGEWRHLEPVAVRAGDTVTVDLSGAAGDLDLYVRLGAQPTTRSYDCRPYQEGSTERCELTAEADGEVHVSVQGYAAGDFALTGRVGGRVLAEYRFNDDAVRFYAVTTEVDWIAESPANVDGPLAGVIDRYTHTDTYTYVLELDDAGRLVGGEWTGDSKKNHPDFVWLPLRVQSDAPVMGGLIDRQDVLEMLAESVAPRGGAMAEQRFAAEAEVAKSAWAHYGPFEVAPGGQLVAALTGDGDADLYVRRGAQPTTRTYDCRPYEEGSAERCTLANEGAAAEQVYVSVRGYVASTFALTVTFDAVADAPVEPATLDERGDVAQGQWVHFELPVIAGQRVELRTEAAADIDLYARFGQAPTAASYDVRGYTASGNERVEYTAIRTGTLHISVHGYAAAAFRLVSTNL